MAMKVELEVKRQQKQMAGVVAKPVPRYCDSRWAWEGCPMESALLF